MGLRHTGTKIRGAKRHMPVSGSGHNTGVEKRSQIRKAQFRAYSGVRLAVKGEAREAENSGAGVTGKIQVSTAGVRVKS